MSVEEEGVLAKFCDVFFGVFGLPYYRMCDGHGHVLLEVLGIPIETLTGTLLDRGQRTCYGQIRPCLSYGMDHVFCSYP